VLTQEFAHSGSISRFARIPNKHLTNKCFRGYGGKSGRRSDVLQT
jgi:hypothetical protein